MLLSIDPEGYARCCDALAAWDVRGALAAVRAPTLVIAGADDPSTPPETVALIAAEISGARFEVIEQAAHIPSVERADVFNRLIEEHL
jgi:3-oxoadipate enol-lactonase/4-carboxymuconolactone decarboxylase